MNHFKIMGPISVHSVIFLFSGTQHTEEWKSARLQQWSVSGCHLFIADPSQGLKHLSPTWKQYFLHIIPYTPLLKKHLFISAKAVCCFVFVFLMSCERVFIMCTDNISFRYRFKTESHGHFVLYVLPKNVFIVFVYSIFNIYHFWCNYIMLICLLHLPEWNMTPPPDLTKVYFCGSPSYLRGVLCHQVCVR